MKVKSQSEVAQLCLTLSNPMDCSLPGSSIHGIFQARVLELGAITFSSLQTDVPLIPKRTLRCAQTCSPFHRACYMFCFGFSPLHACFPPRMASWSSPLTPNFNPTLKTELQCHLLPETFPEPSSQEGLFCLWFLSNILCIFYIILNHQFFKKKISLWTSFLKPSFKLHPISDCIFWVSRYLVLRKRLNCVIIFL